MSDTEELIARVADPRVCTDSLHRDLAEALATTHADLAAREAVIESVRAEVSHAYMNGHHLCGESQGVAPGVTAPAARLDHIEAALSLPLADRLNLVKAEAWDEGHAAEKSEVVELPDGRKQLRPTANPYRTTPTERATP